MVSEIRVWEGREERTYVSLRGRAERLANSTSYSGRAMCELVLRRAIEGTKGRGRGDDAYRRDTCLFVN
jgi:hypothetical protein